MLEVCIVFVCVEKTTFNHGHIKQQEQEQQKQRTPSSGGTTDINRLSLGRSIFFSIV